MKTCRSCFLFTLVITLLAIGSLHGQDLMVNGHPLVPNWGVGTVMRDKDSGSVYVVDTSSATGVTLTHIDPARFHNCYAEKFFNTYSHALNQPSVFQKDVPGCVQDPDPSIGALEEIFEPGSNGARHIGMSAWTNAAKDRMQGVIKYESDTNLKGVCGGAVVGLIDSTNHLLKFYTPPTGCVNGKFGGHANDRFVGWEDDIPQDIKDRIAEVRIKVIFTEGHDKGGNAWEALSSVAQRVGTIAEAAQTLGALL